MRYDSAMQNETKNGPFRALAPIVLGSGSPRRRELLENIGISFEVVVSKAEEPAPEKGETPVDYAKRMAHMKAAEVASRRPGEVVIGSDTVVALDDEIMGKPKDNEDALRMLTALSGKTHQVVSGVSVIMPDGKTETFAACTDVVMRQSSRDELLAYIATGEPADKAGAYAIQGIGTFLVREITGSYTNVVGLPVARLVDVLLERGAVLPQTK